ncbi:uncharacterized protein K02A2.6-like [Diprion similis]|uniref:uncharacterized protein K02A2.6-like n=1 Tax=Diprion similis TaxID=362088 RepID=UPI001EF8E2FF|nr:uncharacterized protein K02A2.6-like [Diprion similis]
MAAGRLQRWALFLSGFDYEIKYIKGTNNGAADGLSRLPRKITTKTDESKDYFNFVTEERLPIRADDIITGTRTDPILSRVYYFVMNGWPREIEIELKAYGIRATEITADNEVLMWGYRVLIASKFRQGLLEEIHTGHLGISKMKSIARQYFWWPNLDMDIEKFGKDCFACQITSKNPERASLIKFKEAVYPFERVHIDYLGPYQGKMYLLIIDSHSKWPEVLEMHDNGRQLVSEEFEQFCKGNEIRHITSAPYHPATNGQAENAVSSFKRGIDKALKDKKNNNESLKTMISTYLFAYRNAPHTSSGESPATRMFGRLDKQIKYFQGHRDIRCKEGDPVLVRDYKNPSKPTWQPAKISEVLGERTYICQPKTDSNLRWKRHTDQIIKVGDFYNKKKGVLQEKAEPMYEPNNESKTGDVYKPNTESTPQPEYKTNQDRTITDSTPNKTVNTKVNESPIEIKAELSSNVTKKNNKKQENSY